MRNRSVAPFFTEKVLFALSISCITDTIINLKKLLDSNDVYLVSKYKSKNDRFRKLPPYFRVKFPCFSSKTINAELLNQQFGVLSAFSFESQKYTCSYKMEITGAASPFSDILRSPLLEQPMVITTIDTDFEHMFSVTCSTDEQIWTRGDSNIIKFYNLQGELLESIRTKSGNDPRYITVSKSGHLVYSDFDERTVNIVMNKQISEVVRLEVGDHSV